MHWFHVHHTLGPLNGISIRQEKVFISLDIDSRDFGPDRPPLLGGRSKEEFNVAGLLRIRSAPLTLIDHSAFALSTCDANNQSVAFEGGIGLNLLDGNLAVPAITHAGPEDLHNNHDWRYLKMPMGALDRPIIPCLQSCSTC